MATRRGAGWLAAVVFAAVWALYATTAAPGTIFGDPSEYQFIPAIWGIAHPPGYAFYTLLAGLWQRVVAVGSIAWRTNLLAGAAGAWAVSRVFLIALELSRERTDSRPLWAALLAALALAVAPDVWQHSIHSNAHIVSMALTATQLWLLVRWSREGHDRWLFALAFCCGLGVAHHPITVWGLPAYAVFILLQRPRLWAEPRTWLTFIFCGLAGLAPWLYFPWRSPTAPFGPTDMRTWEGFLRHATAQGLRVNLFHFGLADQPDRWRVFLSLLRLQFPWPLLVLMGVGAVILVRRHPRSAWLWGLFLLGHLGFTLNSVQDVMAYLLHPLMALGLPLAVGALALMDWLAAEQRLPTWSAAAAGAALLLFPLGMAVYAYPRLSLRGWRDADQFVANLRTRFAGQQQHAALVADWEHLTPYFYTAYAEHAPLAAEDMRPVYVTGASPWAESVFGNLPLGPVYLSNYRRDIRDLGFRLRPEGNLWRVLEPPARDPVAPQTPLEAWADGRVLLLGYDLPARLVMQGSVAPLTLYARVAVTQSAILMPYARLGDSEQRWTTDSRHLTPDWLPGEIIAERYELFIPYTLPPGNYPLRLGYVDMSAGNRDLTFADGAPTLDLGQITVQAAPSAGRVARALDGALTNLGNDVALMSARAAAGWQARRGLWQAPLPLKAGQSFHLTLTWRALARPRTSYTVFIHLLDGTGALRWGHDYTPLGGAFPSYLWFPKWLEGQQVEDPYRLTLPADLAPGQYWLEVGMYEMGSVRRIPQLDESGTMTGDRLVLGPVSVTP